jgi:hypothetical protein
MGMPPNGGWILIKEKDQMPGNKKQNGVLFRKRIYVWFYSLVFLLFPYSLKKPGDTRFFLRSLSVFPF